MHTFQILHLSDFHISTRTTRKVLMALGQYANDPAATRDLARFVWQADDLDLVLITGDLAATGRRGDLLRALEFVDAQTSTKFFSEVGAPTLQGGRVPIAVLPGNHDRYKGYVLGAGNVEFDRVFRQYWAVGQGAQYCLIKAPSSRDCLALILADFSLISCQDATPPFPGCLGQGHAYGRVIRRLTSLTESVREEFAGTAVIWVIHFAPEHPTLNQYLRLVDGSELVRAAVDCNVRYILCGHTHESFSYEHGGVIIHCAGTACAADDKRHKDIHIAEVTVDEGVALKLTRQDFRWDGQDFVVSSDVS